MEAQGEVVEQELAKRQAEMEAGPLGGGKRGSSKPAQKGEKKGARCVFVTCCVVLVFGECVVVCCAFLCCM